MRKLASAPGKLIALGEYAILEGSPALVLAVSRRAFAHLADSKAPPLSRFLERAEQLCTDFLGLAGSAAIRVDSAPMRSGKRKLGLGSSAAATVAYVAARLSQVEDAFSVEQAHALAHRAHGEVSADEGARGSGADIAASCWGGVLAVTPGSGALEVPTVRPIADSAHWVALDSGRPANTRKLVERVRTFAKRSPGEHRQRLADIEAAARSGIAALESSRIDALRDAFERGLTALGRLGAAAGLELVTETHVQIAEIARKHGGAAKPTGAGGGDAALAVFENAAAARQFRVEMVAAGIQPVDLSVEPHGVAVFPSETPSCPG